MKQEKTKSSIVYLYLALVCFLGIVAIFIADGYMGVYDTVVILSGEYEQTIDEDDGRRGDIWWSTSAGVNQTVTYTYTVDNRRFSTYSEILEVSILQNQEKVQDILSEPLEIAMFDKKELSWTIDTADFGIDELETGQSVEYTVLIKRGDTERRIILSVNGWYNPKTIPVPVS